MLPSVKQTEPFESDINIVFSVFRFIDFFEWDFCKIFNPIFHEQFHRFSSNFHLFLWINTLPELLFQNKIPAFLFDSGFQSFSRDLLRRLRRSWHGGLWWVCIEPGGTDIGYRTEKWIGCEEFDRESWHVAGKWWEEGKAVMLKEDEREVWPFL